MNRQERRKKGNYTTNLTTANSVAEFQENAGKALGTALTGLFPNVWKNIASKRKSATGRAVASKGKGTTKAVVEEASKATVEPTIEAIANVQAVVLYSFDAIQNGTTGDKRLDVALRETIRLNPALAEYLKAEKTNEVVKSIQIGDAVDAKACQAYAKTTLSRFATREYNGTTWAYANAPIVVGAELARRFKSPSTVGNAIAYALAFGFRAYRANWTPVQTAKQLAGYALSARNRGLLLLS